MECEKRLGASRLDGFGELITGDSKLAGQFPEWHAEALSVTSRSAR